ncbi:MAG: copper homeostasis protein CutC [Flavobacteriaceae bacterium]|nr:copper homeostasis protein CutC [Flavobacteriaceae bacterium]
MLLEICTNSYQSAVNAEQAGAQRIELCTELGVGGITPSYGLLTEVMKSLSISVFVLIRPRSGNFVYSDSEFTTMKRDIELCKKLGCHGIVSGVLNKDNALDIERTKELIELSKPLPFTFHRAFDLVQNPIKTVEQLIQLGVARVLTSGQETNAAKGIDLLKQLRISANNQLIILPGGGINSDNALVFKNAGFFEIHCSASKIIQQDEAPKISMNSVQFLDERNISYSSTTNIKAILNSLKNEK